MRRVNALIVLFVALALIVASAPGPVFAQTVTTSTTSFVDRFGNTVTVTDTFVDGVLVSRDQTTVRPDGTLTLVKHWDFYPSGTVKSYTEQRLDGFAPYKIVRQYDENGVVRDYYAEMYINGELSLQSFQTFDAEGYLLTKEERLLTTLADSTKVWSVTYETWSANVLVSLQVVEYPYGYDFNAGDGTGDDGSGDDGSGDDGSGDDSAEHRPGWGHGDMNHEHDGPPGAGSSGSSSSGNGNGSGQSSGARPGHGHGDVNHEHSGAPGQNK